MSFIKRGGKVVWIALIFLAVMLVVLAIVSWMRYTEAFEITDPQWDVTADRFDRDNKYCSELCDQILPPGKKPDENTKCRNEYCCYSNNKLFKESKESDKGIKEKETCTDREKPDQPSQQQNVNEQKLPDGWKIVDGVLFVNDQRKYKKIARKNCEEQCGRDNSDEFKRAACIEIGCYGSTSYTPANEEAKQFIVKYCDIDEKNKDNEAACQEWGKFPVP